MKIKSILLALIAIVSISISAVAQPQGKQSYNFTRALEEAKKATRLMHSTISRKRLAIIQTMVMPT